MITIPKVPAQLKQPGPLTGTPVRRVEGRAKVTGEAKYAAEFAGENLVYGYILNSTIAKGKILKIDTSAALKVPGVLAVFTHENRPPVAKFQSSWKDEVAPKGRPFHPLEDATIKFSLQPIALVVAETFQLARYATRLIHVAYEEEPPKTNLQNHLNEAKPAKAGGSFKPPPKPKGKPDAALKAATIKVQQQYFQPSEHHNPIETFGSTVIYNDDGSLTVYDKIQGVLNSQKYVCGVFGLKPDKVRVINPYMGGGFGSGLRPQHQLYFATMAALQLKRSVRVEMTRPQMFSHGHRPATIQNVSLACEADGKLTALKHEIVAETSLFEGYAEIVVNWSGQQYPCDNVKLTHKLVPIDVYTPLPMRAPGAVTGSWAIESAIDELSYAAGKDPVEMRLINYSEVDGNSGQPFSSKALRKAIEQGAERFGWSKRSPEPRSMRDGKFLVGYGMAIGAWDAQQGTANAKAQLSIDGKLVVGSATADIGTGTYTAMSIIAADTLGLPLENVTFKLGDSKLPVSPIEGGSWTVSSVGSAVKLACDGIGKQLLDLAKKLPDSPLANAEMADVEFVGGRIAFKGNAGASLGITEIMRASETLSLEETVKSLPDYLKQKGFVMSTHNAVFVEVKVDEAVGSVMVSRVVNAVAAGRIINAKAATSQVSGATVWGISMALHEESLNDTKIGRFMNHDLAEYHVATNGDIHDIDAFFVEENDDIVNPLGAKGVGEIGICGVAAAVANAVYHATGKRVRSLPITPDKLL